jgi:hypothetical protein
MTSNHGTGRKRFGWLAMLLATMVLVGGCDEVRTPQVKQAEPLAQKLFEAEKHQDWDKMIACYGHAFFRTGSKEAWLSYLKHVNQVLGPLKSYTLESETADTRFSGDFYILQYHTVYARGDAHEIITIREPSDKDVMHIIGHHIASDKLLAGG